MGLFRRRPLHEQLAEQAGLTLRPEPPHEFVPQPPEPGIHGLHRFRQWDAVVTVEGPELELAELTFVALPDGTLLIEDDVPEGSLAPLADELERAILPPYRASAVRREASRWAVGAKRITVVELPDDTPGEELTLTVREGERSLIVDGERAFASVRELERLGELRHYDSFVAYAERLDEQLWEVQVTPL